jgi:hypothetical protein
MAEANPRASCPTLGKQSFREFCVRSLLEPKCVVVEKPLLLTLEVCRLVSVMAIKGQGLP